MIFGAAERCAAAGFQYGVNELVRVWWPIPLPLIANLLG